MSYRRLRNDYKYSSDKILEGVRKKWEEEMWGDNKDSYLILGTTGLFPTFIVLGVFWPRK